VNGGQTVMKLNGPRRPRAVGSLDPEAFNVDGWGGLHILLGSSPFPLIIAHK
jgi:hypothetical protein